jgi:hypothetical protein
VRVVTQILLANLAAKRLEIPNRFPSLPFDLSLDG